MPNHLSLKVIVWRCYSSCQPHPKNHWLSYSEQCNKSLIFIQRTMLILYSHRVNNCIILHPIKLLTCSIKSAYQLYCMLYISYWINSSGASAFRPYLSFEFKLENVNNKETGGAKCPLFCFIINPLRKDLFNSIQLDISQIYSHITTENLGFLGHG